MLTARFSSATTAAGQGHTLAAETAAPRGSLDAEDGTRETICTLLSVRCYLYVAIDPRGVSYDSSSVLALFDCFSIFSVVDP